MTCLQAAHFLRERGLLQFRALQHVLGVLFETSFGRSVSLAKEGSERLLFRVYQLGHLLPHHTLDAMPTLRCRRNNSENDTVKILSSGAVCAKDWGAAS